MASYEMDASPGPEGQKEPDSKKISFRFCRECSNMLYPKEDRTTNTLMFACRTCQFSEPAGTSCIYRNSLKETIAETPGNVMDVAQDPTVGNEYSKYNSPGGSSFKSKQFAYLYPGGEDAGYDSDMEMGMAMDDAQGLDVVPEFCTFCGEEILCPICEKPTDGGLMLEADDPAVEVAKKGDEVVEQEKKERSLSGAGLESS